jgi:hypothetical protein
MALVLSPSPLPLCGIPTSISFVKEEWDICFGERVRVRGYPAIFVYHPSLSLYDIPYS